MHLIWSSFSKEEKYISPKNKNSFSTHLLQSLLIFVVDLFDILDLIYILLFLRLIHLLIFFWVDRKRLFLLF